jgi:nickel-dependent lactate racemase
MLYAAKAAGVKFILNVVMNSERTILGAFAGDLEQAHLKGTEFLCSLAQVNKVECDIVVTTNGGYPLDQNIYQAVKGMVTAESASKQGDVIIQVAGLKDGTGGRGFYKNLAESNTPQQFLDQVAKKDRNQTIPDQWESQVLARILSHRHVIMVSDLIEPDIVTNMHMEYARTFGEALERAYAIKGKEAKVVVIPDGLAVIPV